MLQQIYVKNKPYSMRGWDSNTQHHYFKYGGTVVATMLAEQLLPKPEGPGLNQAIGIFYKKIYFC